MVAAAGRYAWSSYPMRMGHVNEDWLDRDPCYLALAGFEDERRVRYARFMREAIPEGEGELIREAVQRGQLTGTSRFVQEVEAVVGRRVERRRPGRPQ